MQKKRRLVWLQYHGQRGSENGVGKVGCWWLYYIGQWTKGGISVLEEAVENVWNGRAWGQGLFFTGENFKDQRVSVTFSRL